MFPAQVAINDGISSSVTAGPDLHYAGYSSGVLGNAQLSSLTAVLPAYAGQIAPSAVVGSSGLLPDGHALGITSDMSPTAMAERLIATSMVPAQVAIDAGGFGTFSPQLNYPLNGDSQLVIAMTASVNYTSGAANTMGNMTNAAGLSGQGANSSIFSGGSMDDTVLNSVKSAKASNITGVTNATDVVWFSSGSESLASAQVIGQQFTGTWSGSVGVNSRPWSPLTVSGAGAIGSSISGGTVNRTDLNADFALSPSGLNPSSIAVGTDYASLTKRLSELGSHGDVVTGWTLTYAPHASH
jgi:hypothetical protein